MTGEKSWKRLLRVFREQRKELHYTFNRILGLRVHETTDPALAREILKRDMDFPTPTFVKKGLGQFIGKAMIVDEGESWENMHNLMKDIFAPGGVAKNIAPVVIREANKTVDRWLAEGKPIDAERDMRLLTAKVVMEIVFGGSISEKQAADIIDAATETINSFRRPSPITMGARMLGFAYDRTPPPPKELKAADEKIASILDEIITARRRLETQPDDVLGRLLQATDVETKKPLTDKEIRHQLLLFVIAGHETTSEGLTFSLYEGMRHPEEVERLRREIAAVAPDRPVQAGDYKKLSLCQNFFKEAMRLHPPAYEIVRECRTPGTAAGIEFKKRDIVIINMRGMHHSEDLWPGAEEFRPDRFKGQANPRAYLPFGAGARTCIGMTMSLTEGTLALAAIFNRATLTPLSDKPVEEMYALTMRPKERLEFTASPRT